MSEYSTESASTSTSSLDGQAPEGETAVIEKQVPDGADPDTTKVLRDIVVTVNPAPVTVTVTPPEPAPAYQPDTRRRADRLALAMAFILGLILGFIVEMIVNPAPEASVSHYVGHYIVASTYGNSIAYRVAIVSFFTVVVPGFWALYSRGER
jgi:hypothetical protein